MTSSRYYSLSLRGENDSKQLDEFQAKFYLNRMDFVTEICFPGRGPMKMKNS